MAQFCGEGVTFRPLHCPFRPTAACNKLLDRWSAGERRAVRAALLSKPLAKFEALSGQAASA